MQIIMNYNSYIVNILTKYLQFYIDKLVYCFNINKQKLNIEKTKMLPFMNARILKCIYI